MAEAASREAQKAIAARCNEMGIAERFAPRMSWSWYGRGENADRERRAELRAVAASRITDMTRDAKQRIEHMSLQVQTDVISAGLESKAAKDFLAKLPDMSVLMPPLDV